MLTRVPKTVISGISWPAEQLAASKEGLCCGKHRGQGQSLTCYDVLSEFIFVSYWTTLCQLQRFWRQIRL